VFQGTRGGVLRNGNFNRRTFGPAAIAIGEPRLTPHGRRHTAASLAIAAGGNVKVVQQMLGHATASMTLDLYGHLFPTSSTTSRTAWTSSAERLQTILRMFCGQMFCGYFADCQCFADILRTICRLEIPWPFVIKGQGLQKAPDLRLCTWARPGSNRRQPRCKRGALPTELQAPNPLGGDDRRPRLPQTTDPDSSSRAAR
jgi:Phage integrase family